MQQSLSGPTASAISSNATSRRIDTTLILPFQRMERTIKPWDQTTWASMVMPECPVEMGPVHIARQPTQKGACHHAIGISRGGRAPGIHALSDDCGRPVAFALAAGNARDLTGARARSPSTAPATSRWPAAPMMRQACATGLPSGEPSPLFHPIRPVRTPAGRRPRRPSRTKPRRAHVLPPEGCSPHCHPHRQTRRHLPVRRLHC